MGLVHSSTDFTHSPCQSDLEHRPKKCNKISSAVKECLKIIFIFCFSSRFQGKKTYSWIEAFSLNPPKWTRQSRTTLTPTASLQVWRLQCHRNRGFQRKRGWGWLGGGEVNNSKSGLRESENGRFMPTSSEIRKSKIGSRSLLMWCSWKRQLEMISKKVGTYFCVWPQSFVADKIVRQVLWRFVMQSNAN